MNHILIDTNIFASDQKRSRPAFRALTRLAGAGKLQLHIPEVVRREFLSQQEQKLKSALKDLRNASHSMLAIVEDDELRVLAESNLSAVKSKSVNISQCVTKDFEAWISKTNAIEHKVRSKHGQSVISAYFAGTMPFGAPKQREDFPDAFIWQAAVDLAGKNRTLTVISADGRIHKAASEHEHMVAYKTLDEFIKIDDCQTALSELAPALIAENSLRLIRLLPTMGDVLREQLTIRIQTDFDGQAIRHRAVPSDNHEARVFNIEELDSVEFGFKEAEYYGDGNISIPFTAALYCDLNFTIHKSDFYKMSDAEMSAMCITSDSDHYFDVFQQFPISITGDLSISPDAAKLQEDLPDDALRQLLQNTKLSAEIAVEKTIVYDV